MESEQIINEYNSLVEKNKPIVSVFMLTHNREKYLKQAIDAVLGQSYTNFVLWVLDNCSEDGTAEMVSHIEDERFLYLYRKSVLGDSNSEFALGICSTEYLIILHDDDIVERDYLKEAVNEIEAGGYAAMSVGATFIDPEGNYLPQERDVRLFTGKKLSFKNDGLLKLYFNLHFNTSRVLELPNFSMVYPSVIYRMEFYKKHPMFEGTDGAGPAGDQYVYFNTERNGGVVGYLDKPLMRYRLHNTQESNINGGFMDLRLLDYLYEDEYYRKKAEENFKAVKKKILYSFLICSLRYRSGAIDYEKYSSVMDFKCVKQLKSRSGGRLYYAFMRLLVKNPRIFAFIYWAKKKVKG